MQNPCFETIKEARNQIYTSKYISHPIIDSDG